MVNHTPGLVDAAFQTDDEEVTEEELRVMVEDLKDVQDRTYQMLQEEKNKSKRFRRSVRRWRMASVLISLASFLIGLISGFGFW